MNNSIEKRRIRQAKWFRNNRISKRIEIIKLLGGKCIKCGYNKDIRAICIDHINGGGCKEMKLFGGSYTTRVLEKINNGSNEYQLLCCNCNQIKKDENNENTFKKYSYSGVEQSGSSIGS